MNPLTGKRIILGVTGSIAAYKAADLASKLHQTGALLDVILTAGALNFITPLTFQSVTGRKAYTDTDLWGGEGHVTHIGLGHHADALVIAPASANTLARLAHGIGDNLLSVTALAASCPLILAPAMDGDMYAHPATQANLEILHQRGAQLIGPAEGHLASGLIGKGRMVEPLEIIGHLRCLLGRSGALTNRRVVVTAGGTQEALDPVRVLTNRSSGKQGYALAQAAIDLGATVTLITAPSVLPPPVGAVVRRVINAAEMMAAVLQETADADVLIMAAAVADFRPKSIAVQKMKKSGGLPHVELEPTEDILAAVARRRVETGFPRRTIGFAAETEALLANASVKLAAKKLDLIAANDVSAPDAGFEVDTNRVVLLFADGRQENLEKATKTEVAEMIMQRVVAWF
ncbi:MAG TPA: bifunctional phosphopantothenoylcysteine decarboxylase/phosphopantothenate--cysteine ligase CoaBC [Anaerolineaceae bacterium]|nr:bifunctional phosphopantothenoylcysteine decarboxylase/phosphopantothenate--cysteine ligase CoaBC [Anaerolineaceae bacterium]